MNIYVLNTLVQGTDTIDLLIEKLPVKGIITLEKKDTVDISGYVHLKDYCRINNLDFISVESYSLKNDFDKDKLSDLDIDILIVLGWQRLIPEWLIRHCKMCAIGAHGSANGITEGRGRSPQNWALILGKSKFYISIFKIDAGIDSGEIIDTDLFTLSKHDDIRTSYYKASWLTAKMIIKNIQNGNIQNGKFIQQSNAPRYLPQRLPEDGKIDWNRTTYEIYNFIRALTKPYPGAYTEHLGNRIFIWKAIPFDELEGFSEFKSGQIIKIYNSTKDVLVKTRDKALLITEYTIEPDIGNKILKNGVIFNSGNYSEQIRTIVKRHYNKYPTLEISDKIIRDI